MSGSESTSSSHDTIPPSQLVREQQTNVDVALTLTGRIRQRRKWTNEINEELLRAYFEVTEKETNMTSYRSRLQEVFVERHPNFDLSAQRLSDQVTAIFIRNLIPESRRNEIKEATIASEVITYTEDNSNGLENLHPEEHATQEIEFSNGTDNLQPVQLSSQL